MNNMTDNFFPVVASGAGMGVYVPVPAVNPQVTRMVIYGSLGLIAVAVAFYLWNRK